MWSTSLDFWPYSFWFVCTLISSDDTITNSFPLGVIREYIYWFRSLHGSIFPLAKTYTLLNFSNSGLNLCWWNSDTFPVAPLELLPPVSTGSSNAALSLSLALSSAMKVQVVLLVNSRGSSSSFNSSRVGSFINSRVKFFQDGRIIPHLVVEHVGVINLGVLKRTFAFILTFAEGGSIVFCFIDGYFSDAANSDPPVGGSLKSIKGATK